MHGVRSLQPSHDTDALTITTPLAIASCTKLLTTICCLQLVEQGKLSLSTDTTTFLPDLAALPILTGFTADDKPITCPRTAPITLQHLLTHSSGLGYDGSNPTLMKWCAVTGKPTAARSAADKERLSTVTGRFGSPLLFSPGTSWTYGSSLDWAGRLVEVVSGLDLDTYMRRNIFERLGVTPKDAGFWLDKAAAGGMALTMRDAASGKVRYTSMQDPFPGVKEAMGGQGLKANMPGYFKVLKSLLADDEVLLKRETTKMMWRPCLSEGSRKALNGLRRTQPGVFGSFVGRFPEGVELDWWWEDGCVVLPGEGGALVCVWGWRDVREGVVFAAEVPEDFAGEVRDVG